MTSALSSFLSTLVVCDEYMHGYHVILQANVSIAVFPVPIEQDLATL